MKIRILLPAFVFDQQNVLKQHKLVLYWSSMVSSGESFILGLVAEDCSSLLLLVSPVRLTSLSLLLVKLFRSILKFCFLFPSGHQQVGTMCDSSVKCTGLNRLYLPTLSSRHSWDLPVYRVSHPTAAYAVCASQYPRLVARGHGRCWSDAQPDGYRSRPICRRDGHWFWVCCVCVLLLLLSV